MPKYEGVYRAGGGSWYFKVSLGHDPLTGKRIQLTKRGFSTATDAAPNIGAGQRPAVLSVDPSDPSTDQKVVGSNPAERASR